MRILLADGQEKVRFALRVLLEHQAGLEVVGEATHESELLAMSAETLPDLVLLAWDLPGLETERSIDSVRACCPGAAVIALSGQPEAQAEAMAAGVEGFVSKGDPPEQLLAAIATHGRDAP